MIFDLKMNFWCTVVFVMFLAVKVKTFEGNYIYWSSQSNHYWSLFQLQYKFQAW